MYYIRLFRDRYMHFILLGLLVLAIVFLPGWWTKRILKKHSTEQKDYPGTGGELARHLLDKFQLQHVTVEETESGDHYDPQSKSVRLSKDYLNGKSLTAITVAAHEVGHAIQDGNGDWLLKTRTSAIRISFWIQRLGGVAILAAPALIAISPGAARVAFAIGFISMITGILVHLITLPVEIDASFAKALPILKQGEYIGEDDLQAARSILTACAMTYVSASLASLLQFWRWFRFVR